MNFLKEKLMLSLLKAPGDGFRPMRASGQEVSFGYLFFKLISGNKIQVIFGFALKINAFFAYEQLF